MSHKQVLVVNKSLGMRKGKIGAQCAHASLKVLLDTASTDETGIHIPSNPDIQAWLSASFTKVVVSVNSDAELVAIHEAAKAAGLLTSLITDNGLTEFHNVPTRTVVAIGPAEAGRIDAITGELSINGKLPLL